MEVGRHDDFVISNIVESHLGNIGTYPCSTEQSFGRDASWKANAILNPLTVHDLHATILHQLGLNHERLTFRYGGRDHRLTDVHGRVVKDVLG